MTLPFRSPLLLLLALTACAPVKVRMGSRGGGHSWPPGLGVVPN